MSLGCLRKAYQRKTFYGELHVGGKPLPWWSEETLQWYPKTSLKDFNVPQESWEETAHDQTNWLCLIRKRADDYVAKLRVTANSRKPEPMHQHPRNLRQNFLRNMQQRVKTGLISQIKQEAHGPQLAHLHICKCHATVFQYCHSNWDTNLTIP